MTITHAQERLHAAKHAAETAQRWHAPLRAFDLAETEAVEVDPGYLLSLIQRLEAAEKAVAEAKSWTEQHMRSGWALSSFELPELLAMLAESNPVVGAYRQQLEQDPGRTPASIAGDFIAAIDIHLHHADPLARPAGGWGDSDPFDVVEVWPSDVLHEQLHSARTVLHRIEKGNQ